MQKTTAFKSMKDMIMSYFRVAVVYRISELTLRNPIWLDKDKDYIDQFPELAPYSNTKRISGLQLCAVMGAIVDEMQSR